MVLLVTGSAGFIGSNFVYYFLNKYKNRKLVGFDKLTYAGNLSNLSKLTDDQKERFIFIKGDINDRKLVDEVFNAYQIDGVINIAAETHVDRSIYDPRIFLETNVLGTQSLLEVCEKYWYEKKKWAEGKKFLQVSTDEVYGSLGSTGHFTEKTPLDPHSPYAASKASGDLIVKAYFNTFKMPINITRCSNNYGPYQFPEKLIPFMINKALNHDLLPIYGDGKQIRDWIHVEDHCKGIDIVLKKGKSGEIYNLGGKNERENIFITKKIISLLRKKTGDPKITEELITHIEDRPGHDRRYSIDPSKVKRDFSWETEINLLDGLEKTVQWYLDNRKWVKVMISVNICHFMKKTMRIERKLSNDSSD